MRNFSALLLIAVLFCSAYSGTVILPSRSWVSFRPVPPYDFSCTVYNDSSNPLSCSSDSTDFYWRYFEGCTCMCLCCPSIAVASKRPFYVSRQAMDYSDYKGDTAKLADTTLFVKCDTIAFPIGISCPFPFSFSSAALVFGSYGLVPGGADTLSTRLLVFRIRFSNYPPLRYVPLKIDRIVSRSPNCPWGISTVYDSIQVTFGNTLTGVQASTGAMDEALAYGGSMSVAESQGLYSISGLDAGENRLEIYNVRGQAVFSRSVNSSSFSIGKNVLRPGLYILYVHSRKGNDRLVFPVH